jgi:WD40 repeat protein
MPPVKSQINSECDASSVVAFSPDGKKIASRCKDLTVIVWDINTGKEISNIKYDVDDSDQFVFQKSVKSIVFSPNGKLLISGGGDDIARVWDTDTGKIVSQMTHKGEVTSVNFSPNGKWAI